MQTLPTHTHTQFQKTDTVGLNFTDWRWVILYSCPSCDLSLSCKQGRRTKSLNAPRELIYYVLQQKKWEFHAAGIRHRSQLTTCKMHKLDGSVLDSWRSTPPLPTICICSACADMCFAVHTCVCVWELSCECVTVSIWLRNSGLQSVFVHEGTCVCVQRDRD